MTIRPERAFFWGILVGGAVAYFTMWLGEL